MWQADFPTLQNKMNGQRLAFLDSAASAQKPVQVLQAMQRAYTDGYANIHRGLYAFSQDMTRQYEAVRGLVALFLKARSPSEIIFTRNATEGINLFAQAYARQNLRAGDEVILSCMEHHANLVPWHLLRDQIGIELKFLPLDNLGQIDVSALPRLLSPRTKIVSFVHTSNALGVVNDVDALVSATKAYDPQIIVMLDVSQAVVHGSLDVQALPVDACVFTGHKLYGPTGVGVLYVREEVMAQLSPYQGGGDMIETVALEGSTYKTGPARFEAGTPAIAEVIGLGAAISYINEIGMDKIVQHENKLAQDLRSRLLSFPGLTLYAPEAKRAGIFSFNLSGQHASDIAMILDRAGVAVRTGHHCCMPLMKVLGITGSVRVSLALYSTRQDLDQLFMALEKAQRLLAA